MSEEAKKPTYKMDFIIINPATEKPMTIGGKQVLNPQTGEVTLQGGREMTAVDAIVTAMKMGLEHEKISEDDLNRNRKIVKKLLASDPAAVHLKSKAVEAIKARCRQYFIPGVSMQILDIFDSEPTQAELDEV